MKPNCSNYAVIKYAAISKACHVLAAVRSTGSILSSCRSVRVAKSNALSAAASKISGGGRGDVCGENNQRK